MEDRQLGLSYVVFFMGKVPDGNRKVKPEGRTAGRSHRSGHTDSGQCADHDAPAALRHRTTGELRRAPPDIYGVAKGMTMNKLLKGAIAGAAGVALLLGGAGTFALWNSSATVTGGNIDAGNLHVADSGTAGTWPANGPPITLAPSLAVP